MSNSTNATPSSRGFLLPTSLQPQPTRKPQQSVVQNVAMPAMAEVAESACPPQQRRFNQTIVLPPPFYRDLMRMLKGAALTVVTVIACCAALHSFLFLLLLLPGILLTRYYALRPSPDLSIDTVPVPDPTTPVAEADSSTPVDALLNDEANIFSDEETPSDEESEQAAPAPSQPDPGFSNDKVNPRTDDFEFQNPQTPPSEQTPQPDPDFGENEAKPPMTEVEEFECQIKDFESSNPQTPPNEKMYEVTL